MKKIKRICIVLLAVCTLFCVASCSVQEYFDEIDNVLDGYISSELNSENTESSSIVEESAESDSVTSSENESDSSEEVEETPSLSFPDNVLDYIALGLEVNENAILDVSHCTATGGAVKFFCSVSSDLRNAIAESENQTLAMLLFPLKFFDEVNTQNLAYMDWITEFEKTGKTNYYLLRFDDIEASENDLRYAGYLYDLPYKSINQGFVGMGVLITTDENGNETYKYSAYKSGNYRTNARSLGYVAAETLNNYALGKGDYTAEQIEFAKTYVNWSVDSVNGLAEPTDDNSTYNVMVSPTTLTLNVGETATLGVSVAQDINVPVGYKSLNESVVTVSETGEIKAVAKGTTIIAAYVAGVPYTVRITINEV